MLRLENGRIGLVLLPPGIEKLFPITFRHRMTADAVSGGPTLFREKLGAEHLVQERKVYREVHVDSFRLNSMMPMMETGRNQEFFQEPKAPIYIRVHEGGIEIDDQNVAVHRHLGEPKDKHGNRRG